MRKLELRWVSDVADGYEFSDPLENLRGSPGLQCDLGRYHGCSLGAVSGSVAGRVPTPGHAACAMPGWSHRPKTYSRFWRELPAHELQQPFDREVDLNRLAFVVDDGALL
jgi:hypothetical protein